MDFGPLNLGKTWKYVSELEKLISHPNYKKNKIYHHTHNDDPKTANAAFLMGAFQVTRIYNSDHNSGFLCRSRL